jgi:hypothetical protein
VVLLLYCYYGGSGGNAERRDGRREGGVLIRTCRPSRRFASQKGNRRRRVDCGVPRCGQPPNHSPYSRNRRVLKLGDQVSVK